MKEGTFTLLNYIDGRAEIWIKYTAYVRLKRRDYSRDSICIDGFSGLFSINKISSRQRFYSTLALAKSQQEQLSGPGSGGKRIIRIRDILFIDAQVYVKTPENTVLKMRDDNGFLSIKIPCSEHQSMVKQLKKRNESVWQN